jgi:hypothetical protein
MVTPHTIVHSGDILALKRRLSSRQYHRFDLLQVLDITTCFQSGLASEMLLLNDVYPVGTSIVLMNQSC